MTAARISFKISVKPFQKFFNQLTFKIPQCWIIFGVMWSSIIINPTIKQV